LKIVNDIYKISQNAFLKAVF